MAIHRIGAKLSKLACPLPQLNVVTVNQLPCCFEGDLVAYALLELKMSASDRLKILNAIEQFIFGPVTKEAVAAIDPMCDAGRKILREITSLEPSRQMQAFQAGNVFRLIAKLNPSLLTALRLCR